MDIIRVNPEGNNKQYFRYVVFGKTKKGIHVEILVHSKDKFQKPGKNKNWKYFELISHKMSCGSDKTIQLSKGEKRPHSGNQQQLRGRRGEVRGEPGQGNLREFTR